jgi:tetratricopeptide (TPR) repeat protein
MRTPELKQAATCGARVGRAVVLAVLASACNQPPADRPVAGPVVEYRSPAGVEYTAQPDTGSVARADSALAADPENVERILELGLAQAGVRQYREAIATFTRGIEIDPDNALLYRWRGHRHLSVRELDAARADLERGLALDSTVYGCWYHLGIVRYVTGDFDGAADAFAHALPLAPDPGEHAGSIDWGWMSLARAGRTNEARAWLEANDDSLPADNAYTRRLELYRGRVAPDALITPADTEDVQVATLEYGLGNWYLLRGDTTQARAAFERSVRSGGWPAFGFIASEAELRRLAGS